MRKNDNDRPTPKTLARVSRLTQPRKAYPLVDRAVLAYAAVVLLFQILFQISPVMSFFATTPLYSIQTYLGLLGGGLIVLDLFTTKRTWEGKHRLFLYAILLLAALSSVRMIRYGIKENLFKLCWAAIQFTLICSCPQRTDRASLQKYLKLLFYVLLSIWFVACCISLYQYVEQIGYRYVVDPLAKDSSATRQGFFGTRLFGIFYTLNHAAYISLFFLVIALLCTFSTKTLRGKICLITAEFVLLCHIILTGSRSAMLSMIICSVIITWALVRNAIKKGGLSRVLLPVGAALLAAVLCVAGYYGLRAGLSRVPYLRSLLSYHQQTGTGTTSSDTTAADTVPAGTGAPTVRVPGILYANAASMETAPTTPVQPPEYDEDILDRGDYEGDVSNGRMNIWRDYIYLYEEVGPIGLSPGNYMPYIMENHPELYIVEYIRNVYTDKYDSGIIYHVHSGYMMVYVSAGILGLLCLVGFIVLCAIRLLRTLLKNKALSYIYIGAMALVASGAFAALTDEGLFFQNNPHTTMFWFALGILMWDSLAPKKVPETPEG